MRAVVFDIGGVLQINPDTGWTSRWAGRLGLTAADLEARLDPLWAPGVTGEATLTEIEARIGVELGLDAAAVTALMDEVWAEYLGSANAPLLDYIAGLRPRYRLGILSNSFVGAREREEAVYGFSARFDVIVYSHEIGIGKPDPRAYAIVSEQLAVPAAEIVFVDDLEVNVAAARAVGMTGVHLRQTSGTIKRLRRILD